jgi:regulator of telomere elongation helicase 1
MIAVLRKGPAGSILSSSFQSRGKHDYKMDLGNTIGELPFTYRRPQSKANHLHAVNLSKVIPEGLLVFFPSYSVMADCISAWKSEVSLLSLCFL